MLAACSSRRDDANKKFLRHASDTVKAVASEVCLPLLWQLAEMSGIEDAACLEFFTEGRNAFHLSFGVVCLCCQVLLSLTKGPSQV